MVYSRKKELYDFLVILLFTTIVLNSHFKVKKVVNFRLILEVAKYLKPK
jgi:hypothetical protein